MAVMVDGPTVMTGRGMASGAEVAAGASVDEMEPPITTMVFELLVWTAMTVVDEPDPRVMDEPGSMV